MQPADEWIAERQAEISRGVDVIAIMALLFVAIAFFVAVLVIANTFSILFAQRMREFALLRCVGVTRRQLRRSVRLEALALGVAASTLGVVAGALGGVGLVALVRIWFADMGAPALDLRWAGGAFAVGVLVTVAAAWLPTRSATKVTPLAALRPDTGPDVRSAAGRIRLALAILFARSPAAALLALSDLGRHRARHARSAGWPPSSASCSSVRGWSRRWSGSRAGWSATVRCAGWPPATRCATHGVRRRRPPPCSSASP